MGKKETCPSLWFSLIDVLLQTEKSKSTDEGSLTSEVQRIKYESSLSLRLVSDQSTGSVYKQGENPLSYWIHTYTYLTPSNLTEIGSNPRAPSLVERSLLPTLTKGDFRDTFFPLLQVDPVVTSGISFQI